MTFQTIAKTATSKPKIPRRSQFEPRPFAPITQPQKLAPHQQGQATQGLIQTKTNLLEIPNFRIEPKKTNLPNQPVQAKLTIGEPGDKYEKEADETARQVVQRIHQTQSQIQQQSLSADTTTLEQHNRAQLILQNKRVLQRRMSGSGITTAPDLEVSIQQARSGGQPLAKNIRQPMEQAFGADFSRVKVHTDTQSDSLNRSIQAKAFTTGQDVFFRQGEYKPNSRGGQELLAHELTHVVQQNGNAMQAKAGLVQKTADTLIQRVKWPFKKKKISKPSGIQTTTTPDQLMDMVRNADEQALLAMQKNPRFLADLKSKLPPDEFHEAQVRILKFKSASAHANVSLPSQEPDEDIFGDLNFDFASEDPKVADPDILDRDKTNTIGFKKKYQQLFDLDGNGKLRLPSIDEVRQGRIGDCYLMAAITSIVKTDPQYIVTMFRDYGDTVSVRLYDVDTSDPDPLKTVFTPRYIKVDKSVAYDAQGKLLYGGSNLWVSMLEKAYAAGGFGGRPEKTEDQTISPSYKKIEAGASLYAFAVLLGKGGRTEYMSTTGYTLKYDSMPWSQEELDDYNIAKSTNNYQNLISYTDVFNQDIQLVHKWMNWLTQKQGLQAIQTLDNKLSGRYQEEIRLEDFQLIFHSKGLDYTVMLKMLNYLQQAFGGKRGTGFYSQFQAEIFSKISHNLSAGKPMTANTRENVGRTITGVGHSVGEPMSKGLVGSHGYTITGCKIDKGSRLSYITLRNPWGKYHREYDMNASKGNKAKEIEGLHHEFDLELSDFTKRFSSFVATL